MATLAEELTALKTAEDRITGNKVANFAYDDYAYTNDDANGVDTYDVNAHQNIPNGTASILKVNPTILTKGWRAQASSITRMIMNHFLGRTSYNLNKVNDYFSTLLTKLIAYLGSANGIATLDANGYVPTGQLSPTGVVKTVNGVSPVNGNITRTDIGVNNVVNTGDSATPVSGGTTKFTTGGAYTELAKKAPNNHASADTTYGEASTSDYGHVKKVTNLIGISTNMSPDVYSGGIVYAPSKGIFFSYCSSQKTFTFLHSAGRYGFLKVVMTNGQSPVVEEAWASGSFQSGWDLSFTVPANSFVILLTLPNVSGDTYSESGRLVTK